MIRSRTWLICDKLTDHGTDAAESSGRSSVVILLGFPSVGMRLLTALLQRNIFMRLKPVVSIGLREVHKRACRCGLVEGASRSSWITVIIATSKNASGLLRGFLNALA